jgi:outer membrane protein TolC
MLTSKDPGRCRLSTTATIVSAVLLVTQRSQYEEALAILAESFPLAEDNFDLAWARFLGGGTSTLLEVLDSYRQAENLRVSVFHERLLPIIQSPRCTRL